MKYKNIIFDFGNVLATFNGSYILKHFFQEDDLPLIFDVIFQKWNDLDKGLIPYEEYHSQVLRQLPERLHTGVNNFFRDWIDYVLPIQPTWDFIKELKQKGANLYILSNASTYFADKSSQYDIVKYFDGVVFSAPLQMIKPKPEIYQYLLNTYHLNPKDCFFIDDLEPNILAGRALGIDGIIFTGDIDEVKAAIGL